jgi:uncharacterized protein (TIGR03435 family)
MAVAGPMRGQDVAAGGKALSFDVVSVKPNKPSGDKVMTGIRMMPDRYSASSVRLGTLIQYAYNLRSTDLILGLNGPVETALFNIEATMDAETVAALKKLPPEESAAQRRLMMQSMLADRFKLKAHRETKELPIYLLVVRKSGSKLKEANPNATYADAVKGPDGAVIMGGRGSLKGRAMPIATLAIFLSHQVNRQVVDKTGLTGKYDIDLKWAPEEVRGDDGAVAAADSAPSLFTVLDEELGLKLESSKGPVEMVVVEHAELPSEN